MIRRALILSVGESYKATDGYLEKLENRALTKAIEELFRDYESLEKLTDYESDQPSLENVVDQINRISTQPTDVFVFWYLGHGLLNLTDADCYMALYNREYFPVMNHRPLLYENFLSTSQYCKLVENFKGVLVTVLDCCHAGAINQKNFDPDRHIIFSAVPAHRSTYFGSFSQTLIRAAGRTITYAQLQSVSAKEQWPPPQIYIPEKLQYVPHPFSNSDMPQRKA